MSIFFNTAQKLLRLQKLPLNLRLKELRVMATKRLTKTESNTRRLRTRCESSGKEKCSHWNDESVFPVTQFVKKFL